MPRRAHVLGKFTDDELSQVHNLSEGFRKRLESFAKDGALAVMNEFNEKK